MQFLVNAGDLFDGDFSQRVSLTVRKLKFKNKEYKTEKLLLNETFSPEKNLQ